MALETLQKALVLALALGALCQAPAFADPLPKEPQGFTLQVALRTAMRYNPSIQAAEAKLAQAKLEKQNADMWWARTLNARANYVAGGANSQFGTVDATGSLVPTAAIGIGMNLGDLLNGPRQSELAHQNIVIAEAELRKTSLEVASQVTVAYQEYEAAKQMAAISGDMVQAAETDMRIAERTFERGQSQANSLLGARLAVQRTRVEMINGSGNVTKAWSNLLMVMGDDRMTGQPAERR